MRIDLHTHSNRSDGTDSPTDLVTKARHVAALDVVAITDHDTTAGWAEATAAGQDAGIRVIRGIELTTKNQGRSQHLLAYEPDPDDGELVALLTATIASRHTRIPTMVERIRSQEPLLTMEAVEAAAAGATLGRPHIADALVAAGACRDRAQAFDRYLVEGRPTYVPRWAPQIEEAIRVVRAAGGVSVIAHPRLNRASHVAVERLEELRDAGLVGVEVDHQQHGEEDRIELRRAAERFGLVVTGSSDYHGTGKVNHELGCNLTARDQLAGLDDLIASASMRTNTARATGS